MIIYTIGIAKERVREHRQILQAVMKLPKGRKRTTYAYAVMLWLFDNTDLQLGKISRLMGVGNSVMTRLIKLQRPEYNKQTRTDKDGVERISHRKAHALTDEEFSRLLAFVKELNKTS